MLGYVIDHFKGFETLGREDRFKFLMDTPDEAFIICVAKYIFLFTALKENQTVIICFCSVKFLSV